MDPDSARAKSSSLPGYASRNAPPENVKKKKWGWSGFFKRSKALPAAQDGEQKKSGFHHTQHGAQIIDTIAPLPGEVNSNHSSLSRKERREAILARAQARRNGPGSTASSSDDEFESPMLRRTQNSQDSLNNSGRRSRSARTERFMQRRSRDEESLRREMAQEAHFADYPHYNHNYYNQKQWLATPESPVTLRQRNESPARAQSVLVGQPKLSTPPPPPPRNPLKKSYLLQVQDQKTGRPTSYSFGDHRAGSLHDYQNVDQQGRLVPSESRNGALHLPLNSRRSEIYSPGPKSPSPFGADRKPPWVAAMAKSPTSPQREFWRSKEIQQQQQQHPHQQQQPQQQLTPTQTPTPPKSARERLAPFQFPGSAPVKTQPAVARMQSPVQQPAQQPVQRVQQVHHVRDLAKLKPSTDRHLEQAICELEQIYQSLRLDGDEDLLDRAERRDLPIPHQQLMNASGSESDPHHVGVTSDLDTMMNWSVSGSFESLATEVRRTPRRSAVPDKVNDDMAVRRLAPRRSQSNDPQTIAAQSGSYLLVSPSIVDQENHSNSTESRNSEEPDIVLDDVAVRHIRQVNQSLKVADPQPPFGIPIGPVAPASPSDYLHSSVTPEQKELRPLMHPTRYPDLVRDDLAFRNLRKDVGHAQLIQKVNTDKLDEVLAEASRGQRTGRKKRAVRSLSANIAQLIKRDAARPSGGGGPIDFDKRKSESDDEDERYIDRNPFEEARAQSLSDLLQDMNWSNNNNNNSNSNNFNNNKAAIKTPRAVKQRNESKKKTFEEEVAVVRQLRPSPSWVERARLTDDEDRVPALAKLYPTSAIQKRSETPKSSEAEHSKEGATAKPPSGVSSGENSTPAGPTQWEESPLFQLPRSQRAGSPMDSSDSGQVSCCGREVRQILHEQIRRHEEERSGGRKRSADQQQTPVRAAGQQTDGSSIDRSTARGGRPVASPGVVHRSARESLTTPTPAVRRMSGNNNEASPGIGTGNGNASAEKRAERIARYKEERRKQLQARLAPAAGLEHSSSSEDLVQEETSYTKYKHRKQMERRQQQQQEARTDADAANSNASAGSGAGIKRFIKRESPSLSEEQAVLVAASGQVRSNRAARLRAAAATGATPPPDGPNGLKKRLSVPLIEPLVCSDGANAVPDNGESITSQVVMRHKAPSGREKDKSTKRKSNLNRALTDEQIVGLGAGESQDDAGKRIRRRRPGEPGVSPSSAETDMNSSVDNVNPAPRHGPDAHLSPSPAADLRAALRKSSQPPAFIRGAALSHEPAGAAAARERTPPPAPSPYSAVPWRNSGRVAATQSKPAAAAVAAEPAKTDDLTARIEALTAMAHQTVAKVDRLTGSTTPISTPLKDSKAENQTPAPASSVKAVASKLLNRTNENQKPPSPLPVLAGRRTPAKIEANPTKSSPCTVAAQLPAKNRQPDPLRANNAIAGNFKLPAVPCDPEGKEARVPVESGSAAVSSIKAVQGILKKKVEGSEGSPSPPQTVRIRPPLPEGLHPILRVEEDPVVAQTDPVSILKRRCSREESEASHHLAAAEATAEPHSILKRPASRDGSADSRSASPDPIGSILKRAALGAHAAESAPGPAQSGDPRPILKKRTSTEDPGLQTGDGPRPILKKKSSTDDEHEPDANNKPKPILKSGRRISADHLDVDLSSHIGRLRRTEPERVREPEADPSPAEPAQPEEPSLSVAERISSLETLSAVAPWRLAKRSALPNAASASEPLGAVPKRRKSLEASHPAIEGLRTGAGLVEAVNRHLAAPGQQQQPDGQQSDQQAPPSANLEIEDKDQRDENDPSKLSLAERMKLFDRPPAPKSRRPASPRKAGAFQRFQTQPITSLEVAKALYLSTVKQPAAIEVSPEDPGAVRVTDEKDTNGRGSPSGLERIRGILRRKSSESVSEMKSILRSKSPSLASTESAEQPKSILKRPNPEDEEDEVSGSSSSSGSDEVNVPAENDLAAKMLSVEKEAKSQPDKEIVHSENTGSEVGAAVKGVPESATATPKATDDAAVFGQSSRGALEETAPAQTSTIIVDSEGSSSGSEVTTKVTLRLGGAATVSTVQESHAKVKKSTVAEETRSGIAARLAALQKNGENEWRKRIGKTSGSEADEGPEGDAVANKAKSSIADRLKVLENAQLGWKTRVHEPDAARFTVAGKMGQRPASVHAPLGDADKSNPSSPMLERKKKVPLPVRVKIADSTTDSSSTDTPSVDDAKPCFGRSTSEPNGEKPPASGVQTSASTSKVTSKTTSRIVAVPRPDDETFTSFFASSAWSLAASHSTSDVVTSISDFTAEDFDRVVISQDLFVEKRTVHVQRRKNASRNPVKSLILNTDLLRDQYEEVDTGVAERELQRIKLEQLAKNSHLAVEALAGLASKEDFSSVALKSAKRKDDQAGTYLLLVKGRRHVQTRLTEPLYTSVNSGDCYVLVTPTDVVQYHGRYSNVIERAKCADVAGRIVSKKDLGCARAGAVQIVEEEKVGCDSFYGPSKRFWNALGRTGPELAVLPAGPPEEDETYESDVIGTNTVWILNDDHLVPYEDYWGKLPQTDMLDKNKVLVFDFGIEMYVWSGKLAPLEARKAAMKLAKALWDAGYDYSECAINPIYHRATEGELAKCQKRPAWGVLKSAKQHMEPVLFREKFQDWPDTSGLIKVKRSESDEKASAADISSLEPCDARAMLDNKLADPDLELEGVHLGRGIEYYDEAERRLSQISTLSVKVWHVMDYEKKLLDEASHGQFHERDTYIIRWQYRITVTGRDLKGQPSQHGLLGRDRFCYFIWHGSLAPPTEQGASALKTVELDEERGPHVRLQQGREPPAFLALFRGRAVIHHGKRGDPCEEDSGAWRLYFVRGEKEQEAHLVQVKRSVAALRSRGCLVLINRSTGVAYVWLGSKSLKHTRQVAGAAAAALKHSAPPEMGFQASVTIKEQYEGAESRDFWEGLGHESRVADRSLYLSLAENDKRFDFTPRLFHLTSWTGQFRADEVASSVRLPQQPCPYPFSQEDLYGANQPSLFLLDNEDEVWLWHGWYPDQPDTDNSSTGSSKLRFNVERRCAMETAIEYCRLKRPPAVAYLVSAGLEPLAFRALFPHWRADDRVAELNTQEGRSADEMLSIRQVLERLKRTTYALAELQARPLPDGVDPTRLESYLNDDDFHATLGMNKDEFYALPAWKQSQMRKETGLF